MRVWPEHKDCKTCWGSGIHHVPAELPDEKRFWRAADEAIPDYREAYCEDCPAGHKRFIADGGDDGGHPC